MVIIEDDRTIREGYSYLIGSEQGYYVQGAYASVEEALAPVQTAPPDVILLDIELPGISGLDGLPRLKGIARNTHILMLTVYDDEENIFRALTLGASGYLTKSTSAQKIIASADVKAPSPTTNSFG